MYDLIEYQKKFEEKLGFCANVFVVNGLNSEKKRSYYLTNLALTEGKRKFPLSCIHSGEPWD